MRLGGPFYHLIGGHRERLVFNDTEICRKWNAFSTARRGAVFAFTFLLISVILTYNIVTTDYFLQHLRPRLAIKNTSRSRCCQDFRKSQDVCGRPDCIWPCPFPPAKQYNNLSIEKEKSFLHETSGAQSLNFRQACVVESLAYRNPNLTVHVLMTGEHVDLATVTMTTLRRHYPNLQFTMIDVGDYVVGTPLERWYHCTDWNRGLFAIPHLSDALRFLSLYKFGGYYFDLDVIHLRSVMPYRNFVVAEDTAKLGSSVIHVDYKHPVIQMAMEQFHSDYKWYVWAHNGPDLVTRILQQWCGVYYISWMTPERCKGFKILPPKSFYPVHYWDWKAYFSERGDKEVIDWDESVIGAHVWNSLSSKWVVRKDSNQYYVQLARSSCPRILDIATQVF